MEVYFTHVSLWHGIGKEDVITDPHPHPTPPPVIQLRKTGGDQRTNQGQKFRESEITDGVAMEEA